MRARKASWALLGCWTALLLIVVAGLFGGTSGLAGAPASEPLGARRLIALTANSLWASALAALIAVAWSLLPAIVLARFMKAGPTRLLLLSAGLLPLFVSPSVLAVCAIRIVGPLTMEGKLSSIYTPTGVALCEAWAFFPVALLAAYAALVRADPALDEAARLETTPLRALLYVTLPLARVGFVAGGVLVFLLAMVEFGIPESLRSQPVLVAEVYRQFGVNYNTQAALAVAITLLVLALGCLAVIARALPRLAVATRPLESPEHLGAPSKLPGAWGRVVVAAGIALLLLPMMILYLSLAVSLNGPGGVHAVILKTWELTREEFWFSLRLGLVAASVVTAFGVLLGAALSGLRRPLPARLLVVAGFIMPGPIVGVSLKLLMLPPAGAVPPWLADLLAEIDDSLFPLMLAYVLRFAPLVALLAEFQLRRVPRDLVDSARLDTGSFLGAWRAWGGHALLPCLAPAFLLALALVIGESGATLLLIPPGTTTLTVRLMTLMHYAPTSQVSALCLLMTLPCLLVPVLISSLQGILPLGISVKGR